MQFPVARGKSERLMKPIAELLQSTTWEEMIKMSQRLTWPWKLSDGLEPGQRLCVADPSRSQPQASGLTDVVGIRFQSLGLIATDAKTATLTLKGLPENSRENDVSLL
ncbi:unnamed protein product [Victoria cruziana]